MNHDTPDAAVRTPRVKRVVANIKLVKQLTHDTIEVVVKQQGSSNTIFAKAGQFCTLEFPGIDKPRAYSLARAPRAEKAGEHTFLIRLLADGEVSQWFSREDRSGTELTITGPQGQFALNKSDSPIVCIAGGSGMSAVFALLEEAALTQTVRDCYFFYGARTQADLLRTAEIKSIARQWSAQHHFEFVPVLSEEPATSDWPGKRGLVGELALEILRARSNHAFARLACFLCGPPVMVESAFASLTAAGVKPEQCYFDRFEDARSPAPVINNNRCVLCDECLLVRPGIDCIVESVGSLANSSKPQRLVPGQTSGLYHNALVVDEALCIRCGACVDACPHGAISRGGGQRGSVLRRPG